MTKQSKFTLVVCALLMLGCVNPPYKIKGGEPTATLKVLHNSAVNMCVDSKWYSLSKPPKQDDFVIPAGKRILLSANGYFADYNVTYTCYPQVGFKPEPGAVYYTDLNVVSNICVLEVARSNGATRTGLERDPSLGPTYCGGTTN